jgi:hypothetical protein
MCTVLLPPGVNPMCTVLPPPGVNPIAVNQCAIHIIRSVQWIGRLGLTQAMKLYCNFENLCLNTKYLGEKSSFKSCNEVEAKISYIIFASTLTKGSIKKTNGGYC